MRLRTVIPVALVLVAASALPILSQTTPTSSTAGVEQEPILRMEVRRVPIDIVVLDKQGNFVKGLTAADFQIKEGGEPQVIKSFDITDGSTTSYNPPKLPTLPANTFVNIPDTPERGPLYILYFDMVNMTQDDQMSFRKGLLSFVDNAQMGTRMMLILNTDRMHILQGFTTDHDLIKKALLNNKGPGPHVPDVFTSGNNYGRWDARAALGNLNWIAEYMSGIPGRKNLIWMSSEFPIPVSPSLVGSNVTAQGGAPANPSSGGGGPAMLDLSSLLADAMKSTYSNMMKSQVALYPLDVGGSIGNLVKFDQMDMIAESTGGRAYYNNNHPSELLDKAVEHGETYYTLSYAPQKDFNGDARHVEVKLVGNHPGLQITYRTLYYAVADDDDDVDKMHKKDVVQAKFLKAKAEDTLYANMEHGAPMVHDLLFSAHLSTVGNLHMASDKEMAALQDSPAFFRTRKPNSKPLRPPPAVHLQKYRIDYGVIDPELRRIESVPGTAPTVEFAVAAFNNEGAMLNCVLNQGTPTGAGAATDANGKKQGPIFRAEQELDVPESAAYIRVAVRDMTTNRTGTLEATLPLKPEKQVALK
jgi:VWFA-related protein